MNQRIIGRGAIACSTVVMAQWIPPFGIQLPDSACQKETEPGTTSSAAGATTASKKCSSNGIFALMERLPERFKLQWSQSRSQRLPGSIERKYQQLIEQAQTLAGENRVAEAIVLMNAIPKNSRHFDVAYQLQETWSQEMLYEATNRYQQADLTTALKLLEAIPATSSQYPQATQLKRKWQQDAAKMQRAIAASKAGNWEQVIQQLEAFQGTPLFQSLPVQELLQLALIKVLEPDPALLEIASRMDSTSLNAAPLPQSPYPISSSSVSIPPPPPPAPRPNLDVDQILNPPDELLIAAKTTKPAPQATASPSQPVRQATTSPSAPSMLARIPESVRRFSLSPTLTSADNLAKNTIAQPEIMAQK